MRTRVLTPQKTPHTPNPPHCREDSTPLQSGCARWTVPPGAAHSTRPWRTFRLRHPLPPSLSSGGPGQLGLVSTILQLPVQDGPVLVCASGGRTVPTQPAGHMHGRAGAQGITVTAHRPPYRLNRGRLKWSTPASRGARNGSLCVHNPPPPIWAAGGRMKGSSGPGGSWNRLARHPVSMLKTHFLWPLG